MTVLVPLKLSGQTLQPANDSPYESIELELNGFFDTRYGVRTQDASNQKHVSNSEQRVQIDLNLDSDFSILSLKTDFLADQVTEDVDADFRDFNFAFTIFDNIDLKIGRQTITWGTADLLFINDTFPKDWISFFIGRSDEYLKLPTDAIRVSIFSGYFNMDVVWEPKFQPSEYIKGERLSYWNPRLGRIAGRNDVLEAEDRPEWGVGNGYALRIHKTFSSSAELAFYSSYGFWKTPEGINSSTSMPFYPKLTTYGFSYRTTMFGGIGNVEAGYYDSIEDRSGDAPFIRNSEYRGLLGFERELTRNLMLRTQYYLEWMAEYDNYLKTNKNSVKAGKIRDRITVRLTKLTDNEKLRLGAILLYSPSEKDAYLRPKISYNLNDYFHFEIGANLFYGKEEHTFFGQLVDNSNVYGACRLNF